MIFEILLHLFSKPKKKRFRKFDFQFKKIHAFPTFDNDTIICHYWYHHHCHHHHHCYHCHYFHFNITSIIVEFDFFIVPFPVVPLRIVFMNFKIKSQPSNLTKCFLYISAVGCITCTLPMCCTTSLFIEFESKPQLNKK